MRSQPRLVFIRLCAAVLLLIGAVKSASAQFPPLPLDWSQFDQEMFEFVGQVKNFPPAGIGLPATSVQCGYLSHDLTTPNPDSFRQGTPVLSTKWRHQVIFDANPSPDPTAPPRTNLFFVTW